MGKVTVCAALVLASGLIGVSHGMVGDAEFESRRLQVKRGLAVSDQHWILSVPDLSNDSAFCDALRANVTDRCTKYHLRSSSLDDMEEPASSDFDETCIVSFQCSRMIIESGGLDDLLEGRGDKEDILEQDLFVHAEQDVDTQGKRGSAASWGLDRIDSPGKLDGQYTPLYNGAGVNVYILDTGVNGGHEEFNGRFKYGGDFIKERDQADMNGHGSHCAGTAAGSKFGVAPGANVIAVKVLSGSGSGSTAGVVQGVKWAVDHQRKQYGGKPAVISMSLGGGANKAMDKAVKEAAKAGNIVVVAAGNDSSDACRYSPARAGGDARKMGVITVMSSDDKDKMSSFSNYGTCTDIIAPGSKITSAWKGGSKAKNTISGTSMACPHVAGVAAQLLEKHKFDKVAAQNELLSGAVGGAIKSLPNKSPNLLVQIAGDYNGPPTKAPTMGPTNEPATLCGQANKKLCPKIHMSDFGPMLPQQRKTTHHVIFAGDYYNDPEGCKKYGRGGRDDRLLDAIVVVRRGGCTFHQKVERAAARGAAGVIIVQDSNAVPFVPHSTTGDSEIWSGMISKRDGATLSEMKASGLMIHVGPPNL